MPRKREPGSTRTVARAIQEHTYYHEGHQVWKTDSRLDHSRYVQVGNKRYNVVRFLWERRNGPTDRRLIQVCDQKGCVDPRCYRLADGPNSKAFETRKGPRNPEEYVFVEDLNDRVWVAKVTYCGRIICRKTFPWYDYAGAVRAVEEAFHAEGVRTLTFGMRGV